MKNVAGPAVFLLAAALPACGTRPAPLSTYQMGEKVQVGTLIYTVISTRWLSQIGQGSDASLPAQRFYTVNISVVNGGAADSYLPHLSLEDQSGISVPEVSDASGIDQWVGIVRKIKPAESLEGTVVFDAPPRAYRLRVSGPAGDDQQAYIDLPLRFDLEAPVAPTSAP